VTGILLLVVGIIGIIGIANSNQNTKRIFTHGDALGKLTRIRDISGKINAHIVWALMHDPRIPENNYLNHPISVHIDNFEQLKKNTEPLWLEYKATLSSDQEKKAAAEFEKIMHTYYDSLPEFAELLKAENYGKANIMVSTRLTQEYTEYNKKLIALVDNKISVADKEIRAATEEYNVIRLVSIITMIVGIALLAGGSLFVIRSLTRPISEMVTVPHCGRNFQSSGTPQRGRANQHCHATA